MSKSRPTSKSTLKNGIRIVTKKMPHLRSVSMGVWVNVGARDETADENGICHFMEHMIFKGTEKRTAFQIAKEFDAVGGHTNAFTAMEHTCFHAKVMDTHLERMVDILSDIFLNSVFNTRDIEGERQVVLQEIGMVEDNPEEYIHILMGRNYWGNNPLGRSILGKHDTISGFNREVLRDFFSRLYQPDRIVISLAGNIEHDRLLEMVGPAFESVKGRGSFPQRSTPEGYAGVSIHRKDLEQAHICLGTKGISTTDPDRYALSLLNTILGGNMSSRLFQEIRERRGLAYNVFSFSTSHVDTGMFGVSVSVNPQKAKETVRLILQEFNKLKSESVGQAELHDAKEFTKGNLMLASESNDNQMVRLAQNEVYFGRYVPIREILERIESVTRQDIIELARHLFQSQRMALTMLGPIEEDGIYESMLRS